MVSAAELKALHSQHNGADSSTNGNTAAPMDDPFPALTEDPFPPPKSAPANFASASAASAKPKQQPKEAQPDLSSQSAFPSLGGGAGAPKGQWGAKLSSGASPSLPINGPKSARATPTGWKASPSLVRATAQEVFTIPTPTDPSKLSQAIARLHAKHKSVKVEASSTRKTATTTFVLKAASEKDVKAARRELTVALAKVVSLTVMIPSSLRAHVIGAKGKNLKAITESTGVRINIPKQDDAEAATPTTPAAPPNGKAGEIDYDADVQIAVTIDGDEINANAAARQIQALVGERTSRTTVRLANIEHIFYPFIAGAKGAGAAKLENEVGSGDVTVRVPPRAAFLAAKEREEEEEQDAQQDKRPRDLSIVVSGDKDQVGKVTAAIEAQVDDMKRSFRILTISIPKRQHRFLVGDAAQDILATTGCSVELASIDDPSDSVTIRGPPGQLPTALTAAMEKANAVRVEVVDLTQAHRGVAGAGFEHAKLLLRWLTASGKLPRGAAGVQVYTPRPALIESSASVQIEIVGSDAEAVAATRAQIDDLVKATPPACVKLIDVDPLLHRFIIGKKGAGLQQYAKRGVDVAFPPLPTGDASGEGRSDVALIFVGAAGEEKKAREAEAKKTLDAVAEEVQKAAGQAADLKTEVVPVAQKLHAAICGPKGTTLNAIIGEERLVSVQLGQGSKPSSASAAADSITVRGPSSEVARVVAELKRIAADAEQDAIVNGHVAELSVDAAHVPHLVGRAGSAINKLRDELGVRIDIDDASSAPGDASAGVAKPKSARGGKVKVTFTGRKENVEEAKKRFAAQSVALADEVTATLKVPENLRGSIIGSQGKYVSRLQDTYSVRINFPSAGESAAGDESQVVIRGPKKGVDGAKAEIIELLDYEKTNNQSASITVSTKSIPRLMGKGGETISRIRDDTEAQIDVERDDKGKEGTTQIKIRGTKAAIDAARGALLAIAKEVDAEETYTLTIDPKFHALLLGARGSNLQDLITRAGGDDARAMSQLVQFPRRGDKPADIVTIRGPAELAAKVKRALEAAAKELSDRVVWGVAVAQPAQRALMGALREVQSSHGVRIFMPNFREYDGTDALANADEVKDAAPGSVVKLQGTPDSVKAAAKDIAANYTSHSKTVTISRAAHAKLANAQFFRSLRNDGVTVDAPRPQPVAAAASNGASNGSAPAATEARIDVDAADDAGSSDWELTELPVQSGEPVTWTLTARDEAALSAAAARISEQASAPEHTHEGKLTVEPSVVPRLVGKQGAALREHESASGASIEIPRNANGLVVIRGTLAAVEAARERIERSAARPARREYE